MRTTLVCYLFSLSICCFAQKSFTDERDGNKYKLIQIGDLLWMQEHMRYLTPESWCEKFPESEACKYGNFYYPSELDQICPEGWRIPTWDDYNASVLYLIDSLGIDSAIFEYDVRINKRKSIYADIIRGINIINDSLYFNIEMTGWIEGWKWEPQDQTTIWVNEDSTLYQTHIHIRPDGFLKHSHKHNVMDKPKRQRRFSVRCVCEAEEQ